MLRLLFMALIKAQSSEFIRRDRKMAALIGLRSPSSLRRLAAGRGDGAAAVEFEQAMLRSFELTAPERDELRRCVMAAAGNEADVIKTREMWAYLRGEILQQGDFYLEQPGSERLLSVSGRYAGARKLHITLLNTPYSTVYPDLTRLMDERNAKIEHYMLVNDDDARTIRMAGDMQRLIAHPNYECFVRVEEKNEQCCYGLARADLMTCVWEDEAGKLWRDMVVLTAPDRGRLLERSGTAELMNAIGLEREKYMRVKRRHQGAGTLDDYVHMMEGYAEMERDGTIYALKPDLSAASVPPDVLRDAALVGGMMRLNDESEAAIEVLTRIFERRCANLEQKRKRTWFFVKRDAMERFARTGVLSDHFWGLRPFTPEERRRILAEQLRLMRVNSGYRLFFLRDNSGIRDIDLCCCERFGALISSGHTDYDLRKGFTEILLEHRRFMRLFEEFAQERLVAQCSGESETRAIIKNLMAIASETGV